VKKKKEKKRKRSKAKRIGGVTQVVEYLPSQPEAEFKPPQGQKNKRTAGDGVGVKW
jgi:hypothetical protein